MFPPMQSNKRRSYNSLFKPEQKSVATTALNTEVAVSSDLLGGTTTTTTPVAKDKSPAGNNNNNNNNKDLDKTTDITATTTNIPTSTTTITVPGPEANNNNNNNSAKETVTASATDNNKHSVTSPNNKQQDIVDTASSDMKNKKKNVPTGKQASANQAATKAAVGNGPENDKPANDSKQQQQQSSAAKPTGTARNSSPPKKYRGPRSVSPVKRPAWGANKPVVKLPPAPAPPAKDLTEQPKSVVVESKQPSRAPSPAKQSARNAARNASPEKRPPWGGNYNQRKRPTWVKSKDQHLQKQDDAKDTKMVSKGGEANKNKEEDKSEPVEQQQKPVEPKEPVHEDKQTKPQSETDEPKKSGEVSKAVEQPKQAEEQEPAKQIRKSVKVDEAVKNQIAKHIIGNRVETVTEPTIQSTPIQEPAKEVADQEQASTIKHEEDPEPAPSAATGAKKRKPWKKNAKKRSRKNSQASRASSSVEASVQVDFPSEGMGGIIQAVVPTLVTTEVCEDDKQPASVKAKSAQYAISSTQTETFNSQKPPTHGVNSIAPVDESNWGSYIFDIRAIPAGRTVFKQWPYYNDRVEHELHRVFADSSFKTVVGYDIPIPLGGVFQPMAIDMDRERVDLTAAEVGFVSSYPGEASFPFNCFNRGKHYFAVSEGFQKGIFDTWYGRENAGASVFFFADAKCEMLRSYGEARIWLAKELKVSVAELKSLGLSGPLYAYMEELHYKPPGVKATAIMEALGVPLSTLYEYGDLPDPPVSVKEEVQEETPSKAEQQKVEDTLELSGQNVEESVAPTDEQSTQLPINTEDEPKKGNPAGPLNKETIGSAMDEATSQMETTTAGGEIESVGAQVSKDNMSDKTMTTDHAFEPENHVPADSEVPEQVVESSPTAVLSVPRSPPDFSVRKPPKRRYSHWIIRDHLKEVPDIPISTSADQGDDLISSFMKDESKYVGIPNHEDIVRELSKKEAAARTQASTEPPKDTVASTPSIDSFCDVKSPQQAETTVKLEPKPFVQKDAKKKKKVVFVATPSPADYLAAMSRRRPARAPTPPRQSTKMVVGDEIKPDPVITELTDEAIDSEAVAIPEVEETPAQTSDSQSVELPELTDTSFHSTDSDAALASEESPNSPTHEFNRQNCRKRPRSGSMSSSTSESGPATPPHVNEVPVSIYPAHTDDTNELDTELTPTAEEVPVSIPQEESILSELQSTNSQIPAKGTPLAKSGKGKKNSGPRKLRIIPALPLHLPQSARHLPSAAPVPTARVPPARPKSLSPPRRQTQGSPPKKAVEKTEELSEMPEKAVHEKPPNGLTANRVEQSPRPLRADLTEPGEPLQGLDSTFMGGPQVEVDPETLKIVKDAKRENERIQRHLDWQDQKIREELHQIEEEKRYHQRRLSETDRPALKESKNGNSETFSSASSSSSEESQQTQQAKTAGVESRKVWAVARGRNKGVFYDHDEAQVSVKNFSNALLKAFKSESKAEKWLKEQEAEEFLNTVLQSKQAEAEPQEYVDQGDPMDIDMPDEHVYQNAKVLWAVAHGRTTGLFDNFDDVQESVLKYSGAEYKKFTKFKNAVKWLKDAGLTTTKVTTTEPEAKVSLGERWKSGNLENRKTYPTYESVVHDESTLAPYFMRASNGSDKSAPEGTYYHWCLLAEIKDSRTLLPDCIQITAVDLEGTVVFIIFSKASEISWLSNTDLGLPCVLACLYARPHRDEVGRLVLRVTPDDLDYVSCFPNCTFNDLSSINDSVPTTMKRDGRGVCDSCDKVFQVESCSSCRVASYCSLECQHKDIERHQPICKSTAMFAWLFDYNWSESARQIGFLKFPCITQILSYNSFQGSLGTRNLFSQVFHN